MPVLQIGNTQISYTIRRSSRVKHLQMSVTPGTVEIVAPVDTPADQVAHFLDTNRRWLFDAIEDMGQQVKTAISQRYISGAKLLYRGRRLMLNIKPADVTQVVVTCKSRFHIQVPHHLNGTDREQAISLALETWMRDRALEEAHRLTKLYAQKLGVSFDKLKLSNHQRFWATCSKDKTIRINWHLIQAPTAVLDYVIAHEVTHLIHQNHGDRFWETLSSIMPDWRERKALLETWEHQEMS